MTNKQDRLEESSIRFSLLETNETEIVELSEEKQGLSDKELDYFRSRTMSGGVSLNVKPTSGHSTDQGTRNSMEDIFISIPDFNSMSAGEALENLDTSISRSFYAVYDGHGGAGCVAYVANHLHINIANDPMFGLDIEAAIKNGFEKTECDWTILARSQTTPDMSGTTAIIIIIVGSILYSVNLGDSRAVLYKTNGQAIPLSDDHKCSKPSEKERIEKAGASVGRLTRYEPGCCCWKGRIVEYGVHRVIPGGLAIARSLGDLNCKLSEFGGIAGSVISEPEIWKRRIEPNDYFVVLASDGLWDNVTDNADLFRSGDKGLTCDDKQLESFMKEKRKWGNYFECDEMNDQRTMVAAEYIMDWGMMNAKNDNHQDNITVLVVRFDTYADKPHSTSRIPATI